MYEDLISSLRLCRQILHEDDKCIEFVDGCCEAFPVCAYQLMEKAADAIEALEIKAEVFKSAYIAEHNARIDEIKRNMWIPVTERLPEEYEQVLTCDEHENIHIFSHTKRYKYPFGINPEHPRYFMPKWWMPIPEPPESEDA